MIGEVKIAIDNYIKNKSLNNRILITRANVLADIVQDNELDMHGVISCLLRDTGLDRQTVIDYCKSNSITRQYLHDYIVSCIKDDFNEDVLSNIKLYRNKDKFNKEKIDKLLEEIEEGSLGIIYWKEILSELYRGELGRPKEFKLKFITEEVLKELNSELSLRL